MYIYMLKWRFLVLQLLIRGRVVGCPKLVNQLLKTVASPALSLVFETVPYHCSLANSSRGT